MQEKHVISKTLINNFKINDIPKNDLKIYGTLFNNKNKKI